MALNPSQKALRALLAEVPSRDDVLRLLGQLTSKDDHAADRAIAIVGATLLEHGLRAIILSSFTNLSPTDTKELFDSDRGTLSTFDDRIKISYAMGLIGRKSRRDLNRIRRIRIVFAHGAFEAHFGLDEISNMCKQFELIENSESQDGRAAYIETVAYASDGFQKIIPKVRTFMSIGGTVAQAPIERRFLP